MEYFAGVLLLGVARAMDMRTTRMATPDLKLETNTLMKWIGWKGIIIVNVIAVILIPYFSFQFAIGAAITSCLAAINNARVAETLYLFEDRQAMMAAVKKSHKTRPFATSLMPLVYESIGYILIGTWIWWETGVPYYGGGFIFIGLYLGFHRIVYLISNWEPKKEEPTQSI